MNHTPGPWLVHDSATLHMNDRDVARVGRHRIVTHNEVGPREPFVDVANARLIAASPDLLAACEEAPVRRIGEDAEAFIERYRVWHTTKRHAAIKKARGE